MVPAHGELFWCFLPSMDEGAHYLADPSPDFNLHQKVIPIKKQDWKWLSVFLLFTSATQAPLFYAFNHMDIGSATLLFYTAFLLTMYIVGALFLKEKFTKVKIMSFITALVGLYVIFSFSLEKFTLLAALMAVLNGIASGGEVSFSKKLSSSYSPLYLTALSWLIIVPTNGILSVATREAQVIPSFHIAWLWQLGYTTASIFAFWFIIAGLKYVEASIGGLIGLLEIVFSITFGIIIFREVLTTRIIFGATLILIAASMPHISDLAKIKTARP